MTRREAAASGWKLDLASTPAVAVRGGARIEAASDTPEFTLLALIASAEGRPFVDGFGGTQRITPELVKATTGETYVEPEPAPPPPPTDQELLQVALAADLRDPKVPLETLREQLADILDPPA